MGLRPASVSSASSAPTSTAVSDRTPLSSMYILPGGLSTGLVIVSVVPRVRLIPVSVMWCDTLSSVVGLSNTGVPAASSDS